MVNSTTGTSDSGVSSPREAGPTLAPEQLKAIHDGVSAAGLGSHRIASMHLVPAGANEADAGGPCHSEQLPDGSWIIVC